MLHDNKNINFFKLLNSKKLTKIKWLMEIKL